VPIPLKQKNCWIGPDVNIIKEVKEEINKALTFLKEGKLILGHRL
jgi:hypothetical protein